MIRDVSKKTTMLWAGAVSLLVYIVLLVTASLKHTFWRDEAESWMVARSSTSLISLLHNVRYQGHPPLWYLILFGISRFSWNPEWMKLPNLLFAIGAAILLLSATKLALPIRLGLTFSYYMLFEYGLLTRNYMIGVFFILGAVTVMGRRERPGISVPIMLAVSAVTSLHAMIVSAAVCVFYLQLFYREGPRYGIGSFFRRLGASRLLALLSFACACIFSAGMIRPPVDSGLLLDQVHQPPGLGPKLMRLGRLFTDAYLPIPRPTHRFWNDTIAQGLPLHIGAFLGLFLMIPLLFYFRNRTIRFFFILTSALMVAELMFSGRAFLRHVGWLFVIFMVSLLLETRPFDREVSTTRLAPGRWRQVLLAGIFTSQLAAAGFALMMSYQYPFSSSRQVASFLREQHLDQAPLAAEPFFVAYPVLAYLQRESAYNLERHTEASFVVWNRQEFYSRRAAPTPEELRTLTNEGVRPVLISANPLTPGEMSHLDVALLKSFTDSLCPMDNYYIYR